MKKVMTLVELKMRKAELRNRMDKERKQYGGISFRSFGEYAALLEALNYAESRLLKPIVISVVVALLFLGGCQTFKGATGDSAWMLQKLSDNIQTQEK